MKDLKKGVRKGVRVQINGSNFAFSEEFGSFCEDKLLKNKKYAMLNVYFFFASFACHM